MIFTLFFRCLLPLLIYAGFHIVHQHYRLIWMGYEIAKIDQEVRDLSATSRHLSIEREQLLIPELLERIGEREGLSAAAPNQVIFIEEQEIR